MKKSLLFSFSLIGQIGLATAIPLVLFGIAGRYLDRKFNSSPWLFLFGLTLATIQIYFYLKGIVRKAQQNVEDI